ncbi:MAG: BatD family protein [Phycisphaerales bacterium]|nr:MAG: BatD family protein [Phycisphaerales bacterium]
MNSRQLFVPDGVGQGVRVRRPLRAACGLLVFSVACSSFAAEDIVLRASVTPQEAWIGQRVIFHIDVLGKDGWAQIKKIGDFDVPGAYVVRTESQGTRLQETIAGTAYTGQRYELSLYPQRSGTVVVPALPVAVTVKAWGLNAKEIVQQAETPRTTFTCQVPPGAENLRGLISTTRLTASQTWQPETDEVKVGDAVKRTIVLQALDVSGMAFIPMQHPTMEGIGIYPGEPRVEDVFDAGSVTGTRIETATFVFERPGEIEIPGIVLPWWDTGARELKHIELPERALRVAGRSTAQPAAAAEPRHQQGLMVFGAVLSIAAMAAVLALRFRGRLMNCWTAWREARGETEGAYFRRLMRSLRSGDPAETLREAMRWLDRIDVERRPARLDLFLRQYGDASVQEAAAHLGDSSSLGGEICDFSTLSRGFADARARWRRRRRQEDHAARILPELNGPGEGRVR